MLAEHTSKVLGIDWAPNTNKIVTCGAVSSNCYLMNFNNTEN